MTVDPLEIGNGTAARTYQLNTILQPSTNDINMAGTSSNPIEAIRSLPAIECGEDAAKYFAFDKKYRNLNHGVFGSNLMIQHES